MHIIEIFNTYGLDILIVLLFIAILAILARMGKVDVVRRIIYALVVEAEQQLGSKTGEAKKAYVIARIYERLPLILRALFTKEDIDRFIDDAAEALKKALITGKFDLLGYSDEQLSKIVEFAEPIQVTSTLK